MADRKLSKEDLDKLVSYFDVLIEMDKDQKRKRDAKELAELIYDIYQDHKRKKKIYNKGMSEEEAKKVLQDMFESDKDVQFHLQRIRMLSKGYWSSPAAKEYINNL